MEQCRGQPANHDPFHKRISGKPLRLQIEATFGSIEHRLVTGARGGTTKRQTNLD
jgi:hypothetical protein